MKKPSFLRISSTIALLALCMFVLGAAFHKYRFFPYELVKAAIAEVKSQFINPEQILASQYSRDSEKVRRTGTLIQRYFRSRSKA